MKPLQTLSAKGGAPDQVIMMLANVANRAFDGLAFHLVDTVLYLAPVSPMTPQTMIACVTMIFEADDQAAVDSFIDRCKADPELAPLVTPATAMQVVK